MQALLGVLLILISAAAFGAMPILTVYAYADGVTPITLLFLRFGIAALVMLGLTGVRRTGLPRGRLLGGLIVLGAVGYAGQSLAYFTALTEASVGLVSLLLYLYPMLVAVLATLFLKEPFTRLKAAALGLALFGLVLTVGGEPDGKPLGIALGILAALLYSCYITFGSTLTRRVSALQSTTVVLSAAACTYGVINLLQGAAFPQTADGWLAIAAIALISTVLAVLTFFAGMARVGPTNAALLSTVEPVVSLLLAAVLLGQTPTLLRLFGGVLILSAVILLSRGALGAAEQVS
ncbi:MAG: DMT family transporter [Chloroflexi bacterium CFX4]|nr:DMT family transporter [Chloroflexi bacterium CFX4]MDL1921539.1 DMT family transporter [Chloroflexi bacterium CFX3]